MDVRKMTGGQRASARAGLSREELAALVKEARESEGTSLTDEQLEGIAGGEVYLGDELPPGWNCPKCGASDYRWHPGGCLFICNKCETIF